MTATKQINMDHEDDHLEERLERFSSQVMKLFEQHCDDIMKKDADEDTQSCSSFDSDSFPADDDDQSLDLELDDLQADLGNTSNSIADLELEFSKDIEALSLGLESAFEQFEENDLVELSKTTQSDFSGIKAMRTKNKEDQPVLLIPVCLDDFYQHQPPRESEKLYWYQQLWAKLEESIRQKSQDDECNTLYREWSRDE